MVQTFVKRPTSPLHFEPLLPEVEDILCPGSDDEADEDEREKKRLRIEILGKQYLEGRPLLIQTAGLRGPFDRGWVNPWAKRRAGQAVDIDRFSEASGAADRLIHDQGEFHATVVTSKRRSIVETDVGHLRSKAGTEDLWEEPEPKRRRNEETARPNGFIDAHSRPTSIIDSREDVREEWLRKDRDYVHSHSRTGRASPSPTPLGGPRDRPIEAFVPLREPSQERRASSKRLGSERHRPSDILPTFESAAINNRPTTTDFLSRPIQNGSNSRQTRRNPAAHERQGSLFRSYGNSVNGHEEEKQSTEEAARGAIPPKDRMFKAANLPLDSRSRHSPDPGTPTPSRLAPYVSDIVSTVAATSAGLAASSKAPKPSPHAAPSTKHLPEFKYRYSRKESSSPSVREKPSLSRNHMQGDVRARSTSTSSSGSSEFAEAFEAAQAKAASGSSHSHPSSPVVPRPETKSIRKNTQAMRRLTFTTSGEPKIAESRRPSRPNSSSSAAAPSATGDRRQGLKSQRSDGENQNQKASTKSSDRSLTNGNRSRNSLVLPEAQIVPDPPIQLAQGPSTGLMETDKQSPEFVSLEEEDSYFDLSTQAAVLKAQRAFNDEILSPLKVSPHQPEQSREFLSKSKPGSVYTTPSLNGYQKRDTHRKSVKHEPQDDEEPMSTQAIADAISPFAVTTIKKRPSLSSKRASFVPSPSKKRKSSSPALAISPNPSPTFHKPLSLATTPSNSQTKPSPPMPLSHPKTTSKPPSSLTSFSMLPNGTLPSTSNLQDGQQQLQQDFDISLPLDPFSTPFATARGNSQQQKGSYDLDAAIEEAGSFLGNWDVEAEARKEGSKAGKGEVGKRGVLSVGKEKS